MNLPEFHQDETLNQDMSTPVSISHFTLSPKIAHDITNVASKLQPGAAQVSGWSLAPQQQSRTVVLQQQPACKLVLDGRGGRELEDSVIKTVAWQDNKLSWDWWTKAWSPLYWNGRSARIPAWSYHRSDKPISRDTRNRQALQPATWRWVRGYLLRRWSGSLGHWLWTMPFSPAKFDIDGAIALAS